jgi:hypothetical protein
MIEFTILLDDSELEFEPASSEPELAFVLPPTARIGRDNDVVHLAPVPVHCFFNGITFAHWLAAEHSLSENDAFIVYAIHDMFKSLLHWTPSRQWPHSQDEFFGHIETTLPRVKLFDDFEAAYPVAKDHHKKTVKWAEATLQEGGLDVKHWAKGWALVGLTIRLQSALPNALSIAYVKRLFVESYVEAMRAEYPDVFAHFDAVSYEYEFINPAILTGNTKKDIEALCRQSKIYLDGRRLVIRTFVGAYGPHWKPDQETVVRLPFWLLLTLREDPISVLFPVPVRHNDSTRNRDFVERVRDGFHRRVRDLLTSAQVGATRQSKWTARVGEIMAAIDETFHIVHTTDFDEATNARRVDNASATETCSMCGSPVPESFACSPVADLGASVSNYTDWHLGDADHACVLCAISHFKTPSALEPARKLIFQRKVVYFSVSTPSATESIRARADLPFFTATGFKPRLEIRSLESLVTLNVVAALYLHDVCRRAVHYHDGERDLWLEATFPTGPFSFVGEVAKAKSKVGMPAFLVELFGSLNRPITLLDPLLPMQIEVPFHALACLWGVSKGRHYEFKYKPLIVSNLTATLPVIWEGYHFIDRQTLTAIETLRTFVETFRHPKVSHRMKLTALASSPEEFIDTLVQLGGFNYETVLERLAQLSGGSDTREYLNQLRELVVQTPLITEIWGVNQ